MSTQAERDTEKNKAFDRMMGYLQNPEFEEITLPEVRLADGTVITSRKVQMVKRPDWV